MSDSIDLHLRDSQYLGAWLHFGHPDTELITLGRRLKWVGARMRIALNGNEDISDLEATESGILDAMAAFEAKTLDGLRVKAEAIKALYPDDDIRDAIAEGGTIARLASSVLADLVKMDFSIFHVSESGIKQSRE